MAAVHNRAAAIHNPAVLNPYAWATRQVPRSGLRPIPKREWNIMPPELEGHDHFGPAPKGSRVQFWAPNREAKPVHGPNPLRRVYPRKEPPDWKDPKRRIPFSHREAAAENSAKNKARFGWGVR